MSRKQVVNEMVRRYGLTHIQAIDALEEFDNLRLATGFEYDVLEFFDYLDHKLKDEES